MRKASPKYKNKRSNSRSKLPLLGPWYAGIVPSEFSTFIHKHVSKAVFTASSSLATSFHPAPIYLEVFVLCLVYNVLRNYWQLHRSYWQ